jgi:alkylation response protein AidB-like acyl-CoA dehydrogenase
MDFSLSEEQKMFKDTAETFMSKEWSIELLRKVIKDEKGYSVDHWKKIADLGWMGMLIDERYGGIGCSFMDLCPILEEMGRALFPSPFLASAIMGASILSEAASEEMKKKLLAPIAGGDVVVTLAVGETGDNWSKDTIATKAEKNGGNYVLKGTKMFVPFAHVSDYIICCAKDESASGNGTTLFLVDTRAKGVECIPIPTFSIDRYSKVVFDGVTILEENVIGKVGSGWDVIEKMLPRLVVSKCMEIVGGLQKVLEITVQWVKDREQFGVPIGSFQAIQHYCAEMAVDVETSKFITYQAAWKTSENIPCKKEVSMAKAWSGEAYQRVTALALQVHGAMGFTEEYDLHFYYKQAKSLQLMYGGGAYHRKIVAQEMGY